VQQKGFLKTKEGASKKRTRLDGLNLYGAAGLKAGDVKIAAVCHGDADMAALSDAAYLARFKLTANPNLPLIGAGPHLCLGMTLARRELEVALGQLVRRMPRLRFDKGRAPRRRSDSLVFRGPESLPVRFD
jgi:hypothetical protein